MNEPVYTRDDFTNNIPTWEVVLAYLNDTFGKDLNCLEVGSYEGRSASYLLHNFVGNGNLTTIDQFLLPSIRHRYFENMNIHPKVNQLKTLIGFSFIELAKLYEQQLQFDFVYIDAGKTAGDNLTNLILAERLLKVGGIMIVDDYDWDKISDPRCCPKLGVDSFVNVTLLSEVFIRGYQMAFKKIKDNNTLFIHNR
jgi:predicted O-methyltransferase YrrM